MRARAHAACFIAFVAALWCLLASVPALASEEILSFHADIQVLPDGTLDVTETIRYAIGAGLETRGIDRDLSMNVRTESGRPARVTFMMVSAKRNGQREPHRIARRSGLLRISAGPEVGSLPAPSEQLYEIRYRTNGRIQAFDGQDVLNWSVTGEPWRIPIRTASVTVTLPQGISLRRQTAERSGPDGQATTLDVNEAADGSLRVSADQALEPGEHFAVSLAWQTVPPVEPRQQQSKSLSRSKNAGGLELDRLPDNWPLLFTPTLIGGLVLLSCRLAAGRHLNPGVSSPEFEPPDGIGPAEARYILERAYDDRCLAAAIVSMAVKRALRIEEEPSRSPVRQFDFRLVPLGKTGKGLTVTERAIYATMFPRPENLTLTSDSENGRQVDRARSTAASWLMALHDRRVFFSNSKCTLAGVALAVATAAILPYVFQVARNTEGFFTAWFAPALITPLLAALIALTWSVMKNRSRSTRQGAHLLFFYLLMGLCCVSLTYLARSFLQDVRSGEIAEIELAAIGSGTLFGCFIILLFALKTAPTKAGRRLIDRLEGFALYLRTAEEERLKFFGHPENTPARLERLRPYIVALGEPDTWTEELANVLSSASGSHWRKNEDSFQIYEIDQSLIDAVEAATERETASRQQQRR